MHINRLLDRVWCICCVSRTVPETIHTKKPRVKPNIKPIQSHNLKRLACRLSCTCILTFDRWATLLSVVFCRVIVVTPNVSSKFCFTFFCLCTVSTPFHYPFCVTVILTAQTVGNDDLPSLCFCLFLCLTSAMLYFACAFVTPSHIHIHTHSHSFIDNAWTTLLPKSDHNTQIHTTVYHTNMFILSFFTYSIPSTIRPSWIL